MDFGASLGGYLGGLGAGWDLGGVSCRTVVVGVNGRGCGSVIWSCRGVGRAW